MVSVCLPSDVLLQHLPSYLGFSYLGRGVSLYGYSSKAQPLLLTLDEGYLLTTALPDLQLGIAPLGSPLPAQPLLLGRGVGPPSCHPWPQVLGHGVAPPSCRPWPQAWGCSSRPPPLALGVGAWGSSSRPPPRPLGFSYLGHGVFLHGCSAKRSHCSLPWTRGISSPPPHLTLNTE